MKTDKFSLPLQFLSSGIKKKRIIIIDDDQLILFGLSKALRHEEMEVDTAWTAAGAIEKLQHSPFDLCLLDIHIPEISGIEMLRIINETCPGTRIIIMTASLIGTDEENGEIREALDNGACHYICKPFLLREIVCLVKLALETKQGRPLQARHLGGNREYRSGRRHPRILSDQEIDLFIFTINEDGERQRRALEGQLVDISEEGMGICTDYPLQTAQVVGFSGEWMDRMGLVRWSTMVDDNLCRAGISFV